jgi:hypothetical protein
VENVDHCISTLNGKPATLQTGDLVMVDLNEGAIRFYRIIQGQRVQFRFMRDGHDITEGSAKARRLPRDMNLESIRDMLAWMCLVGVYCGPLRVVKPAELVECDIEVAPALR